MTTESAIEILIERKRQNEIMRDNQNTFFSVSDIVSGEKNARKRIDALDIAIRVLLEQQERENPKPITNADRIRAMSDEDLAWELMLWRCEAVAKHHGIESQYPDTQSTILGWLQQPAEEADDGKEESDSGGV